MTIGWDGLLPAAGFGLSAAATAAAEFAPVMAVVTAVLIVPTGCALIRAHVGLPELRRLTEHSPARWRQLALGTGIIVLFVLEILLGAFTMSRGASQPIFAVLACLYGLYLLLIFAAFAAPKRAERLYESRHPSEAG